MAKKNFLLLSLDDAQTKKVATIVSNESCRKILDYLSDNEATESELAEKLNVPLSTVHYNMQQLMHAGLVTVDEFHYSKKGKEVNHYKLANKYIIISPRKVFGIKQKLRNILPAGLIALGAAFIIQFAHRFTGTKSSLQGASDVSVATTESAVAAPSETLQALNITEGAMNAVPFDTVTILTVSDIIAQYPGLWFFLGSMVALSVYLFMEKRQTITPKINKKYDKNKST